MYTFEDFIWRYDSKFLYTLLHIDSCYCHMTGLYFVFQNFESISGILENFESRDAAYSYSLLNEEIAVVFIYEENDMKIQIVAIIY